MEGAVGKDDHTYLAERAAEEMAAAERATSVAAANVHRELALRYSLKLILPDLRGSADDAGAVGVPKTALHDAPVPSPGRSAKRGRA
jgi:hypothetical protein